MIRTLLFDLSDVLVVGLTGIEARLQAILPYRGDEILRQLRSDAMLDFLLGYCSEEEYLGRVKHAYGWEPDVDQIKAIIRQHFKTAMPGAAEIVARLARDYPLYLLSDHGREWARYIEAEHAFLGLFTRRFYSFELHLRKNNPETYREVLRQIDVPAAECLFVDDRAGFLAAAGQAGLTGILFENCDQLKNKLREYSIVYSKYMKK
jgi:HAD superfamily hydrolase (TIGR01509 family)